MDAGFIWTLVAVFVAGAAVIVGLWWTARLRDKAAYEKLTSAPERHIPGFTPTEQAPQYLSELESRTEPAGAVSTDLDDDVRERLRAQLDDADLTFDVGYVLGDFATDRPTTWAVLDNPVVVLAEELTSMRDLLGILSHTSQEALVVVSSSFGGDVVDTLRANKTRRLLRVVAILADADTCTALAESLQTEVMSRADLQSGWVPELPRVKTWISSATKSHSFFIK